ncbi:MAG TPA: TetR family transcriptional regulator [Desulfobacter sp.]|uniref:TetR/AcrR family transcriptional regulator n=1 Tax=unclassified Desulfobacter TaxID=2634406 RepID=UPI000E9165BD|nr:MULTISPECIES: TetR/AcrR family transcriptional regulator [unclassified Desulfobacter]MBP8829145.1 TetR/AcrR family transcriptional regulator [Desulfobacter sp.]MBP9599473.1 TetR/AcrR family transcriptional regulator [Desulfobacter sp.]HAR33367.1 TetR family transcriptional regulator [Desulfobacter sp.]HRF89690.1 TetR/AcrR family transcriptional regulator [Desulfobacter postgatei]
MQKRKSDKYHNILNSAGAVFAEHGFYKATISQIAARAGVADGTLYLYFKNKDDILYQYLSFKTDVVFEKMNAAVAKGTDAESKLRNLIRCHLEEFQRDKNMAIIFQSEVRYLRDIESQVKDISKMYFDLLSDIIEQGQVEGTMRQDLFVGLVKRFILGAVEGVISTWVSADGRYDLTTMAEPLVDLYMTGVRGG